MGAWYFEPPPRYAVVWRGAKNSLVYHSGSLALGSFLIALVRLVKWMVAYAAYQAKMKRANRVLQCILRALACLIWMFEKCLKFLSRHAYIQIALLGKNFCTSAKAAFNLALLNAGRVAVISWISPLVHLLSLGGIVVATVCVGKLLLEAMCDASVKSTGPMVVYGTIGWVVGRVTMSVFGLAVDTSLQCFLADEELHKSSGGAKYSPGLLKSFVKQAAIDASARPMAMEGCASGAPTVGGSAVLAGEPRLSHSALAPVAASAPPRM